MLQMKMALICSSIHLITVVYFFAVVFKVQHKDSICRHSYLYPCDMVVLSVTASMTSTQMTA